MGNTTIYFPTSGMTQGSPFYASYFTAAKSAVDSATGSQTYVAPASSGSEISGQNHFQAIEDAINEVASYQELEPVVEEEEEE